MRIESFRIFIILFALSGTLAADQIVLTNGDTLTGSIVKKEGGKLTFKSDILGEVTVPWDSIKTINAKDVTVIAPDGKELSGAVSTAGSQLEVATPSGPQTQPLAAVSDIRNAAQWERVRHPGLGESWAGTADFGLALARGNAHTYTITTGLTAARQTLHDLFTARFTQIYGTARVNGVQSAVANAIHAGWAYNHNVGTRGTLGLFNDYDHDVFQSLDLRFVFGGDIGMNLLKTETTTLAVLAGGDYSRENFSPNISRNSGEANFGDDFTYKLSRATVITQSLRFFPNLSETGEYRMNFDLNADTALKKWLSWHVVASDRFLSNPLFGRQRNDILFSTGFRVSFAR